jgi:hypothetical protein
MMQMTAGALRARHKPPECASGNGHTAKPQSARPRGFAVQRHIH